MHLIGGISWESRSPLGDKIWLKWNTLKISAVQMGIQQVWVTKTGGCRTVQILASKYLIKKIAWGNQ